MTVRSSGMGLLVVIALVGAVRPLHARTEDAPATEVSAAAREKSRAAFRRGVTQLRAQDWSGARTSFEEAWSLIQHPSILLNLGIARLRTDDPVLAEQDLVRFLSEDPGAAPDELNSARDALAEARAKIGTLRIVTAAASPRVSIDGKPIAVRAHDAGASGAVAEARLKAGAHSIVVEADGFATDKRSVEVPAKSETEVRVTLVATTAAPASQRGTSTRTILGWSLAGLGGVGLVASGAMALQAASLSSDYENPSSKSFQSQDVKSDGIGYRTGADIALITGLLAGAGAIVLLFTDLGAGRIASAGPSGVARLPSGRAQPPLLRW